MSGDGVTRAVFNVVADDLAATRDFYVSLFGLEVDYDTDWFVHMKAPGAAGVELGVLRRDHAVVPAGARGAAGGVLLTLVVGDVDAVVSRAEARGARVVERPRDLFYGQRRAVIEDPNGALIDVSTPVSRQSA